MGVPRPREPAAGRAAARAATEAAAVTPAAAASTAADLGMVTASTCSAQHQVIDVSMTQRAPARGRPLTLLGEPVVLPGRLIVG
jgi:hypothetical protein